MLWHIKRGLLLPQSLALNSRQGTPKKMSWKPCFTEKLPRNISAWKGERKRGKEIIIISKREKKAFWKREKHELVPLSHDSMWPLSISPGTYQHLSHPRLYFRWWHTATQYGFLYCWQWENWHREICYRHGIPFLCRLAWFFSHMILHDLLLTSLLSTFRLSDPIFVHYYPHDHNPKAIVLCL